MSDRYDVTVIGSGGAGQLKETLGDVGMYHGHLLPHHAYLKNGIPVAGVAHQAGTCRYGGHPASSVLNTDCRASEFNRLYRIDPSVGAVIPALTAMANAIRVGDHLMEHTDVRRADCGPGDVA